MDRFDRHNILFALMLCRPKSLRFVVRFRVHRSFELQWLLFRPYGQVIGVIQHLPQYNAKSAEMRSYFDLVSHSVSSTQLSVGQLLKSPIQSSCYANYSSM